MYYWNVLELENKKEKITRKMVKEKYQEIKKRLIDTYKEGDPKLESSINLLNSAYVYCNDDTSIAIRNKVVQNSERPNAALGVERAQENQAIIKGRRKDIRELDFLKNENVVGELLKMHMNFNQLVPPEQKESEIYYDVTTGEISSERRGEADILLARRKNRVRDGEFLITKDGIFNLTDKLSGKQNEQLTKYSVIRANQNSITSEVINLYGEIDLDKFEKDEEYKATVYKALEKARVENNPYIGSVEESKIKESGLEKSATRQLRNIELGIVDQNQDQDGDKGDR